MTIQQFTAYLENPNISEKDAGDIRDLCRRYPYFYAVQALYLKHLKDTSDIEYFPLLKTVALQAPDRAVLHKWLDRKPEAIEVPQPQPEHESTEAVVKTEDAAQAQNAVPEAKEPKADTQQKQAENKKAVRQVHVETEYKLDEGDISPEHKLKHQDLIDKFLEADPHIHPVGQFHPTPPEETSGTDRLDIRYSDEDVTDSVLSESLARIYIKQKQYAKAIRIFEKLNLKYPEKSTYFADQIRFLNKVIENS